jgi:hypothetical protein
VTVSVISQVKVVEPEYPALSVTVILTGKEPPVVGVPVMAPVVGLILSPGGRVEPSA